MSNYIEDLNDCLQETFKLLHDSCDLKSLLKINLSKIQAETLEYFELLQPKLTILGSYNAGKSTLVNVLLANPKAALTGEIPLTQALHHYWWRDVRLVDTPGLNSAHESQKIAIEQLHQACHIIFIMREHEVESHELYRNLTEVLKKNRRIIIIFNHQSSPNEVEAYLQRIDQQIKIQASRTSIDYQIMSNFEIVAVNLKTALCARLNKNQILLEHSGYPKLLIQLTQWLNTVGAEESILKNLRQYVDQELFMPLDSFFKEVYVDPEQLRSLYKSKLLLEKERIDVRRELRCYIQQQVTQSKTLVTKLLEKNDSGNIEQQLEHLYQQLQEGLIQKIKLKIEVTNHTVIKALNVQLDILKQNQAESTQAWYQGFLQHGRQIAEQYQPNKAINLSSMLNIQATSQIGQNLLRQNVGGAALQVFMTAYDAYQAHQQEQKDNERSFFMTKAKHRVAESIQRDLYHNLLEYLEHSIQNSYDEKLAHMQKTFDQLLEAEQKFQDILDQFTDLHDEFKQLKAMYI